MTEVAEPRHCRAADGGKFYPLAPERGGLTLKAAVHAISRIGRFNGHVKKPFYVAQHCVLVSRLAEKLTRELIQVGDRRAEAEKAGLEGLGHDLSEGAVQDMTTPLKAGFPDFKALEKRWEKKLSAELYTYRYGALQPDLENPSPYVKVADRVWLGVDRRDLVGEKEWWSDCTPMETLLASQIPPQRCWGYKRAEREWIARYEQLTGGRAVKPSRWYPLLRLLDRVVGTVLE